MADRSLADSKLPFKLMTANADQQHISVTEALRSLKLHCHRRPTHLPFTRRETLSLAKWQAHPLRSRVESVQPTQA